MKLISVSICCLVVGDLLGLAQELGPRRNYTRNDYYVLRLDQAVEPRRVALRLGIEHEGLLGELHGHHVFRAPKAEGDIVEEELRRRRNENKNKTKTKKRDEGDHIDIGDVLDGILLAEKQHARSDLEVRIAIPSGGPIEVPDITDGGTELWKDTIFQKPTRVNPIKNPIKVDRDEIIQKLNISDPNFKKQWHLLNTRDPGHDINVTGVWLQGITGKGVNVAIVDDGVEFNATDIAPNYSSEGSRDFVLRRKDLRQPEVAHQRHGTRCAGLVAAARNDICGIGVAYDSTVSGIRLLGGDISDADEAEAMSYNPHINDIYSCSWGPTDNGKSMFRPSLLVRRAILRNIYGGRSGRGSIYVFASGNGGEKGDNCNFDGYTNSIYSITVGSVDAKGYHPPYAEPCSANLVVTYSSGDGDFISTTDVGDSKCYDRYGGTSASAPIAAGIFALVLQARPELTWRDLQYLAIETATTNGLESSMEWKATASGRMYSHRFGYGKLDAYAIVEKARHWELVKPQAWYHSPKLVVNHWLGISTRHTYFDVTEEMLKGANLAWLEHVTVTIAVEHRRRGQLSASLTSPEGVTSHIATNREGDNSRKGYRNWTFMTVMHWGESGVGRWALQVLDRESGGHKGKVLHWSLQLWGEAVDGSKAEVLVLPDEED